MDSDFDIIVVGGGHAGVEAAAAGAHMGLRVLLCTLNKTMISNMPCNPHIGGSAKGIVVREIDALGGMMAIAADHHPLQIKMLNTGKGPGVQCLRSQQDKKGYPAYMNAASIIALILLFVALVVTIKLYGDEHPRPDFNPVRFMARVAIFGAMAAILYAVPVFHFTLPFLPSFLEFHFDEIPAFICGFAYGPVAAGCVIAVKTLIKLPFTSTMGAGELSDLILSCLYVIPAVIIYGKVRNLKGVAIGFGVATLIQVAAAMQRPLKGEND